MRSPGKLMLCRRVGRLNTTVVARRCMMTNCSSCRDAPSATPRLKPNEAVPGAHCIHPCIASSDIGRVLKQARGNGDEVLSAAVSLGLRAAEHS